METPFHFFTFWGSAEKASMLDFLCARKKIKIKIKINKKVKGNFV